ncbi:MAG: ABC transporter substrate-binding protein [Synergistales bacterium]|nr:ABC transporter substrate-binding protein [Synergistales bacterium]
MRKLKVASQWVLIVVIGVLLLPLVAGCRGVQQAKQEVVVVARLLADIENVDPAYITAVSDQYIATNVYSGLVRYKPGTGEIEPDLAEDWDISPDGLVYTFHLRRGVKWHKGMGELTSEDVKYSFERILDPATKSLNKLYLEQVADIKTPDKYTVQIKLKEPYAPFLAGLAYRAGWIVNKKGVEAGGKEYGRQPVGTGPFVFSSYQPGVEVVLAANPDYFGGKPKVDT